MSMDEFGLSLSTLSRFHAFFVFFAMTAFDGVAFFSVALREINCPVGSFLRGQSPKVR